MTFQLQDSAPCRGSSTLATQGEASSRFSKEVTENVSMALLLSKERPARETAVWEEGDDEGSGEEETEELMECEEGPRLCSCHSRSSDATSKGARNKLIVACLVALVFMIAEVVGGYLANSLAIMSDAAHMLSDFAAFLISLFALWIGRLEPSRRMSFGWHRAEVVGAVISVLIIWVLTGVLVYEAILRIINQDYEIDADIMLITACGGVFVNIFMMAVLGHGHSHGGGHGHEHSLGRSAQCSDLNDENRCHQHKGDRGCRGNDIEMKCHTWTGGGVSNGSPTERRSSMFENINVRAAFIHVIGDLIQSVGVVIAGYIIKFWPSLKLADPICTFLFSALVLFSTVSVMADALLVIMEATPRHIQYDHVLQDLQLIPGVRHAHSLHIWSLTTNRPAVSAHLATDPDASGREILDRAYALLREKHGIEQVTLQVEEYQSSMNDCHICQRVLPKQRYRPHLQ
eukprot:Em0007g716a